MSENDDDFMKNWQGTGVTNSPIINPSGGAYCDYSSTPFVAVKPFKVTFDYESWFTGNIDTASLALGVQNVDKKLVGYLASSVNLCDTLSCTANSASCNDIYNKAVNNFGIVGIYKNSTDIIQTKYVCEQPKPVNQLPIFDRIVCIPVTATISVLAPAQFNSTQIQDSVWKSIKDGMATGNLNTPNQVVGLVFTGTAHTKLNTSGTIRKEMRPVGVGLLTTACILLFLAIVGFVAWCIIKRRRNSDQVEEEDDLSLQKDDEESYAPTDSFMSDDAPAQSPTHEAPAMEKSHSIARKESEVSRYSVYPPTKGPSVVTTSNASVKKNEPHVQATTDEEFEVNQFFCCNSK